MTLCLTRGAPDYAGDVTDVQATAARNAAMAKSLGITAAVDPDFETKHPRDHGRFADKEGDSGPTPDITPPPGLLNQTTNCRPSNKTYVAKLVGGDFSSGRYDREFVKDGITTRNVQKEIGSTSLGSTIVKRVEVTPHFPGDGLYEFQMERERGRERVTSRTQVLVKDGQVSLPDFESMQNADDNDEAWWDPKNIESDPASFTASINPDDIVRDERGRFANKGGGDTSSAPRPLTTAEKDLLALKAGSAGPFIVGVNPDGSPVFTPERQALHDKIVGDAIAGVRPSASPTYYMLGGGPASGKSTMLAVHADAIPGKGDAVQVNADDIKKQLPEYVARIGAGDHTAATFTHEESSYLAQRIVDTATALHLPVVLDATGDSSVEKMAGKIDDARAAGYRVEGHYASVPIELALERNTNRATDPTSNSYGRVIHDAVVREITKSVSEVFPQVADKFDHVTLYDTSGDSIADARLIGQTVDGKFTVADQSLYDAFIERGK